MSHIGKSKGDIVTTPAGQSPPVEHGPLNVDTHGGTSPRGGMNFITAFSHHGA